MALELTAVGEVLCTPYRNCNCLPAGHRVAARDGASKTAKGEDCERSKASAALRSSIGLYLHQHQIKRS